MNSEINSELLGEMRKVSHLLALILAKEMSQIETIGALDKAGLSSVEIAKLLGSTGGSVRGTLSKLNKKPKPKKSK